jgi:hypothetical protein
LISRGLFYAVQVDPSMEVWWDKDPGSKLPYSARPRKYLPLELRPEPKDLLAVAMELPEGV